ncbi:DNA-binding transcriptional LysR family regulator [Amycolatopsis bartoniae]|uniref:LysR family transcriptional regulator n=1 Tax=Amycolatopsis bartoniae TaxID=941986 RepID=A0A8H9J4X1_9PSEU|nr:LysR family transcriptional regulator [Amycolatopsis bartoniae]MBB2933932.1 DNA-binding transcriptional LysR family regulator [Amycolatopsis bartoniae]TVT01486.1 LysR family transcriptional regulator [Amycolatopsis bartoniae]GHF88046.1 LysR family transcriptional regulator [Amycolatopsis bartoniae]
MLDVRRLQILRAVITSGSITAAARNLGYTPSAISQQLATLEREAGVELLERVGRGVRPTPAGALLSEHAETLSAQLCKAEAELAELKAGHTGRLAVRYFATAGAALVPPAVAAVRREFPGIQLDLKLREPYESIPEVEAGEADVAIVVWLGEWRVKTAELVHLLDDPYRAALPRTHPLAGQRVIDLADLRDEQWVGTEGTPGPCRDTLIAACAAAGFAPNFVLECEDYQTAQGFVAAGLGISLVPLLGLGSPHPGVVLKRIRRPEPTRSIHAAVATRAASQPAVRHLLETLRAAPAAA